MMKKIAFVLSILVLTTLSAREASAQRQFDDWSATEQGRGTLRIQGQRDEQITRATVDLRRNGDLEIRVLSITPWVFTGRWFGWRGYDVEVEITDGLGRDGARGRGTVRLSRGGGFERIEITGETRRQSFSISFVSGDSSPSRPDWRPDSRRSEYTGAYRTSAQSRWRGDDYRIIWVLRIYEDGSAQLSTRYQGNEPQIRRDSVSFFGLVLREVQRRRKVIHTGTWREVGRRLEVNLTTWDDRQRGDTRFIFYFADRDRKELTTVSWDRNLYGSSGFQFERIADPNADDDDRYDGSDTDINLFQRGRGLLTVERRRNQNITGVSVTSRAGREVDVTISFFGANRMTLSGRLERRDAYSLRIRLVRADNANADGFLTVDLGSRNSITSVYGEGRLDGQPFSLQFSR